jgi:hypothetical protein
MGHYLDSWLTVGVAVNRTEEDKGCGRDLNKLAQEGKMALLLATTGRVTMGSEQERK